MRVILFLKAQRKDLGAFVGDMFGSDPPLMERKVQHKGYTDKAGHYHRPHEQMHKVKGEHVAQAAPAASAAPKPAESERRTAEALGGFTVGQPVTWNGAHGKVVAIYPGAINRADVQLDRASKPMRVALNQIKAAGRDALASVPAAPTAPAPARPPATHTSSTGEPLWATDEPGVYQDADGAEVEDAHAQAVKATPQGPSHERVGERDGYDIHRGNRVLTQGQFAAFRDGKQVSGWHATELKAVEDAKRRAEEQSSLREKEAGDATKDAAIAKRLLAGGEPTDGDLAHLGLRKQGSEFKYLSPVVQRLFGISRARVREAMGDTLREARTDMGTKFWTANPKRALMAAAAWANAGGKAIKPKGAVTDAPMPRVEKKPAAASEPQEGDTKTEAGITYVLRGGRWHRADADIKVLEPSDQEPPAHRDARTYLANMHKPAVIQAASDLVHKVKATSTLQAMVAMRAGKVEVGKDLTAPEQATAAWLAANLPMTHHPMEQVSPGVLRSVERPVSKPSEIDPREIERKLSDMLGIDKRIHYLASGLTGLGSFLEDPATIAARVQRMGESTAYGMEGVSRRITNHLDNAHLREHFTRLVESGAYKNPKTWGQRADIYVEMVRSGLMSKPEFARKLADEFRLSEPMKKEIADGAPSLEQLTSGERSVDDLVTYRLVGSLNQAKINDFARDVATLKAALRSVPPAPQYPGAKAGKDEKDRYNAGYKAHNEAHAKALADAGFSEGSGTSRFNRKQVAVLRTPSGNQIELGVTAWGGRNAPKVFMLPMEKEGKLDGRYVDAQARAGAIYAHLADNGLVREATPEDVAAAAPKEKRPAPVRKVILYQPRKATKQTRMPADAFYGQPQRGEADLPKKEIANLMRADIKRGIEAGRIPKGMKISLTTDHNSIDVRVTGVPQGMPVVNPDYAVVAANQGRNWVDTYRDHDAVKWVGKPPRDLAHYSPELQAVMDDLKAIHGKYNWDKSDMMTDYYHVNYYGDAKVSEALKDDNAPAIPDPNKGQVGDTITIGGITYELQGNPPRWHKVASGAKAKGAQGEDGQRVDASPEKRKSTADKMRAMAAKHMEQAESEMSRDRLANTPRRARMAAGAIGKASQKAERAKTLANLADAHEAGTLNHLRKVTTAAAVETMEEYLRDARSAHFLANGTTYSQAKDRGLFDEPPNPEAVHFVQYPTATRDAETWQKERAFDRQEQLRRIGINSASDLANALGEYIQFRAGAVKEDPVAVAERELVNKGKLGVDFFPTPKGLADRMAQLAEIGPGDRVLEPSAGNGNLADAVRAEGGKVDVVELSHELRNVLKLKGHNIIGHDFNDVAPEGQYDAVVMNPPFSKRQDAGHIMRAWDHLKPGGRLVAIAGEGVFFGQDQKAQAFRDWLDANDAEVEKLPEGSFLDRKLPATTGVNARLIVVRKPVMAADAKPVDFASMFRAASDADTYDDVRVRLWGAYPDRQDEIVAAMDSVPRPAIPESPESAEARKRAQKERANLSARVVEALGRGTPLTLRTQTHVVPLSSTDHVRTVDGDLRVRTGNKWVSVTMDQLNDLVSQARLNEPKPAPEDYASASDHLAALQDWRDRTGNSNQFEDRKEDRAMRAEERAEKARRRSAAARSRSDHYSAGFAGGQPILVGHHSEARARRDQERSHRAMRAAIDEADKAQYHAGRADSIRSNAAISSDDEDAIPKLKAKLEQAEARQKRMKAVNAAHKRFLKNPASLDASPLSDRDKQRIREYKPRYTWEPHPHAPFEMQNNNANIKRMRERVADLERRQEESASSDGAGPVAFDGGRVHLDHDANRLRIYFDAKPAEDVREQLKRSGFRWSRTEGAWQRQISEAAKYEAARITGAELRKARGRVVLFLKAMGPRRRKRRICTDADAMVQEHERLVRVLRTPEHDDDLDEAEEQARELARYRKRAAVS